MATDVDIAIALMTDKLKDIAEGMKEARESRKETYQTLEKQNETLMRIEHRLEKVETFVTTSEPTLAEWRAMRYKIEGAGTLGRWLWVIAGFSIGAAVTVVAWWQKLWGQ